MPKESQQQTKTNPFKQANNVYFDSLGIEGYKADKKDPYSICVKQGLCFHCKRQDTNPKHRPKSAAYGLCDECMEYFSVGNDKIERHEQNKIPDK